MGFFSTLKIVSGKEAREYKILVVSTQQMFSVEILVDTILFLFIVLRLLTGSALLVFLDTTKRLLVDS